MAQYTIIQDIEAEDKLLGPLSLRQFIYAGIVVALGFIGFSLGRAAWFLALPFVPPMIFFGLLAAPFGQNQSSEIWLLAKIRYFLFPRRRVWDQTGIQDLVRITAPKKVEPTYSKGFSETEVTSRLKALANTLDTRGWAIKNVTQSNYQAVTSTQTNNERLIDIPDVPSEAEAAVRPSADVLDETSNPVASDLTEKLNQSSETHRQELLDRVRELAAKQAHSSPPNSVESSLASTVPSQMPAAPVVHPQEVTEPEQPHLPQPIINNAGNIVHEPEPHTIKPKHRPEKAVSEMTTPADTGILDGVTDTGSQSAPPKQNDADKDDSEVVIPLR